MKHHHMRASGKFACAEKLAEYGEEAPCCRCTRHGCKDTDEGHTEEEGVKIGCELCTYLNGLNLPKSLPKSYTQMERFIRLVRGKNSMENIKIHDCVEIKSTHKDPEKTYYGSTYRGVVVALGENSISIINEQGDSVDHDLDEKGDYTWSVRIFSEIENLRAIKSNIASLAKCAVEAEDNLKQAQEWEQTFKNEITLLGKIMRLIK